MDYVCWNCGSKDVWYLGSYHLKGDNETPERYYCRECYEALEKQRAIDLKEYIRLKNKLMFERAVRCFERQEVDVYEYKEAIEAVQEFFLEHPDKFESSDEIIAAIVLTHEKVQMYWQYQIEHYRLDCVLPEIKVVLEVDGHLHQFHKQRDSNRDIKVKQALGKGWEIVRIPTKYLERNAKQLLNAIIRVREDKIIGLI